MRFSRQRTVKQGDQFGRGTVIEEFREKRWSARLRCDCGAEYTATLADLFDSKTQSCGCLRRETSTRRAIAYNSDPEHVAQFITYSRSAAGVARTIAFNRRAKVTHGLSSHPLYVTWRNMLQRCENPGHKAFQNYGGRGITICEGWHDVATFTTDIERLLGPRPPGMSLDRTDNDGNYEPGNVRWATHSEQMRNQQRQRHQVRN